ncbi:MAG TPA: MFS transporter [Elusimicrobiota bacterium]|nr:MFS transporter [Elusimicrobiota bacterium]
MTFETQLKSPRVWSWALYDFANSAFATTVLAVVFNVYFVKHVVGPAGFTVGSWNIPAEALWSYTVAASMLFLFLLMPLLGAIADHSGRKRQFLIIHWLIGSLASAALFFVRPGTVLLAMGLFMLANIGFAGGNVFYNAFLPSLGDQKTVGRLSGFGWAVGYLGGGLCLALNLWMIRAPHMFGLSSGDFIPVRASLGVVGLWWIVFSIPMVFWVKETGTITLLRPDQSYIRLGWGRLCDTYRNVRHYRNLFKFWISYLLYNDGIETMILMASVFGAQALGMSQDELVMCFLMIQGVAFLGALLFGWMADKIRHKPTLFISLGVYTAVTVWACLMTSSREFWVLGVVVGLVLGGSQAASRSFMTVLIPPEKNVEFFSFFALVGKLTTVLGPLTFGLVSQYAGLRAGVASLLVFFVMGALLLLFVKEPLTHSTSPSSV